MTQAVGIDFGTSNSTVGFLADGRARLVALENGKTTIPSAIFFDTERHQTLFGRRGVQAYVEGTEGRLLRALKSILGSSLIDDVTQVGGGRLSFKAIISQFLSHLKRVTEREVGSAIDRVVLGRPVRFVDDDDAADRLAQSDLEEAARAVGFREVRFQFEPIAAALDYEQRVTGEELALIADIGGGTSDFSIIKVSPERRGRVDRKEDILANTGVHVGGTHLDSRLSLDQVMPLFGLHTRQRLRPELELPVFYFHELSTWHRIVFLYTNKTKSALNDILYTAERRDLFERFTHLVERHNGHRLAGDVEAGKIALSDHDACNLELNYVEEGLRVPFARKLFEESITRERQRILHHIRHCLDLAGVKSSDITTLFLTGGTTAVPSILSICKSAVPEARVVEGDKLGSVGIGLALDASTVFG